MVDKNQKRAEILRSYFPESVVEEDFSRLRDRVDAAIVALPGHLNAGAAHQLLEDGISVLIEKPFAVSVEDATKLEVTKWNGESKLAVGFIRREAIGVRLARECISNGMLGTIRSFSIEDGYAFAWEAVDEFRFDRMKGGGILLDIGSHVLDTLCFWFGDITIKRYIDDCKGGVETNCYIEAETESGITGSIELSWNRVLRNTARIVGTRGTLEVEWYTNSARLMTPNGLQLIDGVVIGDVGLAGGATTFPEMFLAQLRRWYDFLLGNGAGGMPAAWEGRRNIELIQACRIMRENMIQPWRYIE
jgi:predicted dehydrogenase